VQRRKKKYCRMMMIVFRLFKVKVVVVKWLKEKKGGGDGCKARCGGN
jgi:uncharacterized membrane protein